MTTFEDRKARADQLKGHRDAVSAESLLPAETDARKLRALYLADSAKWAGLLEESEADRLQAEQKMTQKESERFCFERQLNDKLDDLRRVEAQVQAFTEAAEYVRDSLVRIRDNYDAGMSIKSAASLALERLEAVLKQGPVG